LVRQIFCGSPKRRQTGKIGCWGGKKKWNGDVDGQTIQIIGGEQASRKIVKRKWKEASRKNVKKRRQSALDRGGKGNGLGLGSAKTVACV